MKLFKIGFEIDTDDNWLDDDVQNMIELSLDPLYHLGDIRIGAISVEEIGDEE